MRLLLGLEHGHAHHHHGAEDEETPLLSVGWQIRYHSCTLCSLASIDGSCKARQWNNRPAAAAAAAVLLYSYSRQQGGLTSNKQWW